MSNDIPYTQAAATKTKIYEKEKELKRLLLIL